MSKAIIFDIKRYSVNDGEGIRSTVFFKGCPLNCWWCHNPESKSTAIETYDKVVKLDAKNFIKKEIVGREISVNELVREIEKDRLFFEESGGGVTFSGGEPLLQADFLLQVMKICKEKSIHITLDTSGFAPTKVMSDTLNFVDTYLFDLKHLNAELHKKYTGVDNRQILDNLKLLVEHKKKVIIRFPVIPTLNDNLENISELKKLLLSFEGAITEIHLLPYHSIAKHKYQRLNENYQLSSLKDTQPEDLQTLQKEFESMGLKVKIGG